MERAHRGRSHPASGTRSASPPRPASCSPRSRCCGSRSASALALEPGEPRCRLDLGASRFHSCCKAVAWVLFLPVMAGLWIWESGWPTLVRLLLVGGIAGLEPARLPATCARWHNPEGRLADASNCSSCSCSAPTASATSIGVAGGWFDSAWGGSSTSWLLTPVMGRTAGVARGRAVAAARHRVRPGGGPDRRRLRAVAPGCACLGSRIAARDRAGSRTAAPWIDDRRGGRRRRGDRRPAALQLADA